MKFIIVLLGLACWAYAQDLSNLLRGMPMPPIPPGMKLEDLKDALNNLPPGMKQRLDSMVKSFGMSMDDVKQALDNPPEQVKQMFEQNAAKAPETAENSKHGQTSEIPQMPDMSAMLGMLGIPTDANPEEVQKLAMEKAKEMGFDLSDPEKLKTTLQEQLKTIMPGVNLDELVQKPHKALQATLKGMGVPTDDPKAMKKLVKEGLKEMGIENVDMDNVDDIAQKLKTKAFHMLDIDENEDPNVLKDRAKKQVVDEMHKMGIDVKEDDDLETVQKKLTTAISKELKNIGVEVESDDPNAMMSAIKKKVNDMGIQFDNMKELQNKLMGMLMQHTQSAFMAMMVQPSDEHKETKMPPKMPRTTMSPHFMPPMQTPNLNLEIAVNIEQTDNHMQKTSKPAQPLPVVMPSNIIGAKETSTDPSMIFGDDDSILKHMKKVRSGLRSGSMSEANVEEMLDDPLHYRLKNTMLKEKLDRIKGMNDAIPKVPEMQKVGNGRYPLRHP